MSPLFAGALGIALVSLADTISTASAFAARTGQEINGNGEMAGIGVANLAAGLFQGFPVSGASLVQVADEQVGAARVAALPDLPQQLLHRDPGFLSAAFAQVVAVRVDERGPVLRGAAQPPGRLGAVVSLDRVQGQARPRRREQSSRPAPWLRRS